MNRTLETIRRIITAIVALTAMLMMIFTLVTVLTCNQTERSLFGYKGFIVRTDSMSSTDFSAGDLIIVKETNPHNLREGDIISFTSNNADSFGEVITHKIRHIETDEDGNTGFVTYGTTTDTNDETIVRYENVLGKYVLSVPWAGRLFAFIKTTPGYIVCIFLPFMILIIIQGVNSIKLFKQYKREQMEEFEAKREKERLEIESERQKLEAERSESQKLKEEIIRLRQEIDHLQYKE